MHPQVKAALDHRFIFLSLHPPLDPDSPPCSQMKSSDSSSSPPRCSQWSAQASSATSGRRNVVAITAVAVWFTSKLRAFKRQCRELYA